MKNENKCENIIIFAESIPMNNQSSGSDRALLFPISYLEEKKQKKGQKIQIFEVLLCIFLDNYYFFVR